MQVYSIDKTSEYRYQFDTTRLNVPYFVKDPTGFERQHPAAGRERCAACFALSANLPTVPMTALQESTAGEHCQ